MTEHARARFNQTAEVLVECLEFRIPVDSLLDRYFRSNRKLGSRDRAFLAESIYGCLRRRRELEALYEPLIESSKDAARWLLATYLLKFGGWSGRALAEAEFTGDTDALVVRARTIETASLAWGVRANLPDWLAASWTDRFGENDALKLAEALNQPAPVDIRVNVLKTTREALQAELLEQGYELTLTPYSPFGLRRNKRGPMFATEAFRQGLFELQDEGSQLVGLMVGASPKERIVDFCAGAGGKTLQLAAMMGNTGVLYAFDVSRHRLERIKPRLTRAGVDTVRRQVITSERDGFLSQLAGTTDAVLVDAPCSGIGTARRNPDIKWRPIKLGDLKATQQRILDAASKLVKPGGRLVYATCSLLYEENAEITHAFLATHSEFRVIPAATVLQRYGIQIADAWTPEGALCVLPHRHGTDGFYALTMGRLAG